MVLIDGRLVGPALPRSTAGRRREFIQHLGAKHGFARVLLVSGDRESEVRYLAEAAGIAEVHAGQSPEQKVEIAGVGELGGFEKLLAEQTIYHKNLLRVGYVTAETAGHPGSKSSNSARAATIPARALRDQNGGSPNSASVSNTARHRARLRC